MGSNQSSPAQETTPVQPEIKASASDDNTSSDATTSTDSTKNTKKPRKVRTGVALIEYECRPYKKAWSSCVGKSYRKFSSGTMVEDDQETDCDDLFDKYRQCYLRGMLKERQKKGLDPPKEGTMLAEFLEEEEGQ
eukprot:Nitzschia sp. Nitz4//scaffold15_size197535//69719//70123//NITZ4_001574-RA/size197535-processed-gene-0.69-mRNA-1//-1//CDS//3329537703//7913//frame0